jgi:allophanate hydrolase
MQFLPPGHQASTFGAARPDPCMAISMSTDLPLDLTRLRAAYTDGRLTLPGLLDGLLPRLAASDGDAVWIARVPERTLRARVAALEAVPRAERGPLWGVPFAVKDNIDVAGLPTTAACPVFAYTPSASATVVDRLVAAGAVVVGKTNLDQFATGLVGVRTPYGVARNPFDPAFIPGGSSSGSGAAVATGLVSFALGTDTAGSGRVPAAFTNIVGLKPTKGLISAKGVVPACRSLDCVSIFALTAADAATVLGVAGGFDAPDPFSRAEPQRPLRSFAGLKVGILRPDQREFFGDDAARAIHDAALEHATALGAQLTAVDLAPFLVAAELLYAGPWVAERTAAVGEFLAAHPDALWPATRAVIETGRRFSAVDAFVGQYRLAELARAAAAVWQGVDVLLLPTTPTIYRVDELAAEPILLNSRLGTYTNFVNLMDLCALAVPAGFRPDGLPQGVTFMAPAWNDRMLAALGQAWQRSLPLPLGATGAGLPAEPDLVVAGSLSVELAVVGAHLSGGPLNHELRRLEAQLLRTTRTAGDYRLYALADTSPAKPGLVRSPGAGGQGIEVEVWGIAASRLGELLADVPPPLAIGTVELNDARWVKGFLCEGHAVAGARDISSFGGWRNYLRETAET